MADGAEADVASADGEDGADLEEDLAAAAVHLAVDSAVAAVGMAAGTGRIVAQRPPVNRGARGCVVRGAQSPPKAHNPARS